MKVFKATVYRTYELELEFSEEDAPEMIDASGKAEWISRTKDIGEWKILDVSVDVYNVTEV